MTTEHLARVDAYLVAGGKYHDIDFARRELLGLLAEHEQVWVTVGSNCLALTDLEGGTFSATALGMFGVDAFTPVINPPNTGILGVGRLRDGVGWDGDVLAKTRLLTLSLTRDHRAFDGAPAAEFVAGVRDRLENWGSAT